MKFLIPTYRRVDRMKTLTYLHVQSGVPFEDIIISVQDAADYDAYRKAFPDYDVHFAPAYNTAGNRNAGLQYIRQKFPGEDICCMDDDIDYLLYLLQEGNRKTAVTMALYTEYLLAVLQQIFDKCRDNDVSLWGVGIIDNPFFMKRTAKLNQLMAGGVTGFVSGGGDILYDESFYLKEDYELVLRLIQSGRRTMKCLFLAPRTNMKSPGGCTTNRQRFTEQQFADMLLEKYEGLIVADKRRPGEIKMI